MGLKFIHPKKELQEFITKFWLFEDSKGLADRGTLIAPNAKPKIIVSYQNALSTNDGKKTAVCREGDICFIGVRDTPVVLSSPRGATGSIGIEFTTEAAYRFLQVPMYHLTNNLFSFSDLYGLEGRELIHKVRDEIDPMRKIDIIQDFLLNRVFSNNSTNLILDFSVHFISSLHGLATMKQLEKKTGYSKRYLDMLFKKHVGISPKSLGTIERFQHFYKKMHDEKSDIYESYYDQSHFIREFKRYTGLTPLQYARFNNDFGRNF